MCSPALSSWEISHEEWLFTLKRSFIFSLSLNWTIVPRCIVDWSVRPIHSCNRYQNAAAWLLTGKQNGDHIVPVLASPAHCEKLILKIFLLVWEALQLQVKVGELFQITGKCKWHLAYRQTGGKFLLLINSMIINEINKQEGVIQKHFLCS